LLLLLPTRTYRADAFVDAATRLDVNLTVASEYPSSLADQNPSGLLTLDFADPERAADQAAGFHRHYPIDAVFAVDDDTTIVAAHVARRIGLAYPGIQAVEEARDKARQRRRLAGAEVPIPAFREVLLDEVDAGRIEPPPCLPCVVKPVALSGSRGVIRADHRDGFRRAVQRSAAIIRAACGGRPAPGTALLVEEYIPGVEYAVEGLLIGGTLHVLTIFDKPDPLEGPFFEETIYLTPTGADDAVVRSVRCSVEEAARALGLTEGPIHAEVRVNERGAWLIELAARPIGGKCGRILRFGTDGNRSLEEILLAHALGRLAGPPVREAVSRGVMMLPTPGAGVFRGIEGRDRALAVEGIEDMVVTVPRGERVVPLPEAARYLGFLFARGRGPGEVEERLRRGWAQLRVVVEG